MYLTLLADILKCRFLQNLDEPRIKAMHQLSLTEKHKLLFTMIECYDEFHLKVIADRLNALKRVEKISFLEPSQISFEKKPDKSIFQFSSETEATIPKVKEKTEEFYKRLGGKNGLAIYSNLSFTASPSEVYSPLYVMGNNAPGLTTAFPPLGVGAVTPVNSDCKK